MDKLHELQNELDESILDYNYPKAGEVTVEMMIHEATMELHKLNKELIIEMEEKDQLIKELSEENQGLKKIIRRMEVQNENKR